MTDIHRSARMADDLYMEKLAARRLSEDGGEIPDPTPMEPPVGYVKQPSIFENVRAMLQREMAMRMQYEDEEASDEEDFNVDDEEFPVSPHDYSEQDEAFVRSEVVRLNKERAELAKKLDAEREELAAFRKSSDAEKARRPSADALPQPVRAPEAP